MTPTAVRSIRAPASASRQSNARRGSLPARLPHFASTSRRRSRKRERGSAGANIDGGERPREVAAEPSLWGDAIVARRDIPTSYHIAVVVDDAAQGVTDVVRGRDLFDATSLQRLLQVLLDLPAPNYRHHRLVLDESGQKLSKSTRAKSIRSMREAGVTAAAIRRQLGFD